MPEISRFLGIVIYMHFNDYNPPHFHVKYCEHKAIINIDGFLPPKVLSLVVEWVSIHQKKLAKLKSLWIL